MHVCVISDLSEITDSFTAG